MRPWLKINSHLTPITCVLEVEISGTQGHSTGLLKQLSWRATSLILQKRYFFSYFRSSSTSFFLFYYKPQVNRGRGWWCSLSISAHGSQRPCLKKKKRKRKNRKKEKLRLEFNFQFLTQMLPTPFLPSSGILDY